MKRLFLIVFLIALVACSTVPSENIVQTAIAQTQEANPTSTPLPPTKTLTKTPTKTPTITPFLNKSPSPSILQCKDSLNLIGNLVTCKIQRAYCTYQPDSSGRPTFCNDGPYPFYGFTLLVWGHDWSDYDGLCLVVNGVVSIYDGKPQIVAESRSQVSNCT